MTGSDSEVEVKPVIKNGKVIRLEVNGLEWPLKKSIPVEELLQVMESIKILGEYVDFREMGTIRPALESWSEEELFKFLDERNETQKAFLKLLVEEKEILKEDAIRKMKTILNRPDFRGWDLGGALAGMGIRVRKLRKEPLYYIKHIRVGGSATCRYEINPKYKEAIRKWMQKQETA